MQLRAPTPEDAPAVLAVLVARDVVDLGAPDYTLADLLDEWSAAELDLRDDALVVQDAGQVVGYAAMRRVGALAVVAPDHEGRGVGSRLLEWVQARERDLGRPAHRQLIVSGNIRAEALLRAAGYAHVRSYHRKVLPLGGASHTVLAARQTGFRVRTLDAGRDGAVLFELDRMSFAGVPDYLPMPFDKFVEEHLRTHDLDPGLSLVAEDRAGEVQGFLLTRRWRAEGVGFVDLLAVHPDRRRRGLGITLLSTALQRFADAGLREAQLSVASDNPAALRLYERIGMSTLFQLDAYERPAAPQGV